MAFTLPPLPYAYDALEPVIDKETLHIHHDKHHQAYTDNLNKAVDAEPKAQGKTMEELFAVISTLPKAIRNHGGGYWNHNFYWDGMAPTAEAGTPSTELAAAIDRDLGGMDAFKAAFESAGATQFGSGWAWLIVQDGKLKVINTPNQDNSLMDIAPEKGAPLLVNDVWEHAYYLKYQNRRPEFLKAFWTVVNWKRVNALFAAATA
ncbi:superoxide dismutase [Brevundimonas sp.]|uniref:superoxide dismutase n=1 Tax=Brevundimonas sp. TaxID=1871086 RepID=UPI003A92F952